MTLILFKLLLLFLFFASLPLFAQSVLKKEENIFQGEDLIIKQQVKYNNLGRADANVLWDFSYQEAIALDGFQLGEYLLRIVVNERVYGEKIVEQN